MEEEWKIRASFITQREEKRSPRTRTIKWLTDTPNITINEKRDSSDPNCDRHKQQRISQDKTLQIESESILENEMDSNENTLVMNAVNKGLR